MRVKAGGKDLGQPARSPDARPTPRRRGRTLTRRHRVRLPQRRRKKANKKTNAANPRVSRRAENRAVTTRSGSFRPDSRVPGRTRLGICDRGGDPGRWRVFEHGSLDHDDRSDPSHRRSRCRAGPLKVAEDEHPRLKPLQKGGVTTAGNASGNLEKTLKLSLIHNLSPRRRPFRRFGAKPCKNFVDDQAASPSSWKTPRMAVWMAA